MPFADISSVDIFATSHVAAPRAMFSADSFIVDRLGASHVAAPQTMPSADSIRDDRPGASEVVAQPDAGWPASSDINKHPPSIRRQRPRRLRHRRSLLHLLHLLSASEDGVPVTHKSQGKKQAALL